MLWRWEVWSRVLVWAQQIQDLQVCEQESILEWHAIHRSWKQETVQSLLRWFELREAFQCPALVQVAHPWSAVLEWLI